ncbi:disulfide bond formation protein DsbB [Ectothiorhodospira magna]|uniref:Disulfide bond formation protein DsbB n=1 Tax=Ectothiorhodospira magna TaxID=867345 RepID=A0A1H8Z540_9GAMM|nr:disulfide bond formation protein B [Ectothiorhodospira magna]SEP58708.1 disulfide bond formation protein DsbB [Ectothiorhodospira magna]
MFRPIWLLIALFAAMSAALSIGLTEWFSLYPCHLCIFQRLLFMVLAVLALAGLVFGASLVGGVSGLLVLMVAAVGMGVAGYQSWLERQPPDLGFSCVGPEMGPIEHLVEWLGQQVPTLFLATGLCDDMGPQWLGMSFANAALAGYLLVFVLGLWALWRIRQSFT